MNKTCFFVPGLNAGGIENYLLRFLMFLPERNNITIIARDGIKGDLYPEFEKAGVNIRFQGVGYFNPIKWILLYHFFKMHHFHTICDFTGNFAGIPLLIGRIAGIKNRIAFYRRSSNAFKETRFRLFYSKYLNKMVYTHATKILSNSQHALDIFFKYRKISDARFKVIPNGVDIKTFQIEETKEAARNYFNIPNNSFVIGHIGRYDPAKNHETFFKVARILNKRHKKIVFLFCGKGTDSAEFLSQLRKYEIEHASITLGLQTKIPLVLKSMDVFYFPSTTEGQPNALIEAILAGIPVITSDIPPLKEIIPDDYRDRLINPADVKSAVHKIEEVSNKKYETNKLQYETSMKFDAAHNFDVFLSELQK